MTSGAPLLHNPATLIRYGNDDADNITNKLVNELIRDLAGGTARDLVDNFEIWGQAPDRFRTLYADIPQDPVGHPNGTGYDLLAQSYFDVLMGVDTVPPVTGLIFPLTN